MKKWFIFALISIAVGWTIINHFLLDKKEDIASKSNIPIGTEVGNAALDFLLETTTGQEVRLTDYNGKKVILNFWASWCGPCKIEMPDMEKFYHDTKDMGIEIVAINATATEKDPNNVKQFLEENKYTFPVLLDQKGQASAAYQIISIPTSFVIDTNGVIQYKHVGPMTYEKMKEYVNNL
ncbi:redoxin domain-containing protein [Bacillus mycoides]|uniref:redoxin domain-containing protein n=1 Tax=Bacillus mycoides TaxID=1405 RepID=UPI002E229F93|nr:redoxin domain-containing protein [Bacillus mycoides]